MLMLSLSSIAAGGPDCENAKILTTGVIATDVTDFNSSFQNWYKYVPDKEGILKIDNCSSTSDAVVGAATGSNCGSLLDIYPTISDCTLGDKELLFNVQKDVPVYILWLPGINNTDTEWNITPIDIDNTIGYHCNNAIEVNQGIHTAVNHYANTLYYKYYSDKNSLVSLGDVNFSTDKKISVYENDCNNLVAVSESNTITFYAKENTEYIIAFKASKPSVTLIPSFNWTMIAIDPLALNCNADTIKNGDYEVFMADGDASYHFTTSREGSLLVTNPTNESDNLMMLLYKGDCQNPTIVTTADNNCGAFNECLMVSNLEPGSYYLQLVAIGDLGIEPFSFTFTPTGNSTVAGETCANPITMELINDTAQSTADLSSYPKAFYYFKGEEFGFLKIIAPLTASQKMYAYIDCDFSDTIAVSSDDSLYLNISMGNSYIIEISDSHLNTAPAIPWKATFSRPPLGSSCQAPIKISLGEQILDLSIFESKYYLFAADETTSYQFGEFSAKVPCRFKIARVNTTNSCDVTPICDTTVWPFRLDLENGWQYLISIESIKSSDPYTWRLWKNTNQKPIVKDGPRQLTMQSLPITPLSIDISSYFSDPENDVLKYSYRCQNDQNLNINSIDGYQLVITKGTEGTATEITLYAYDEVSGFEAYTNITVEVDMIDHGTVTSIKMPDVIIAQNKPDITIDASKYFVQTKDSTLIYTYSAPEIITVHQDGSFFTLAYLSEGMNTMTFTATDEFGSTSSQTISVTSIIFKGEITIETAILDILLDNSSTKTIHLDDYFTQSAGYPITYSVNASDNTLSAEITNSDLQLSSIVESEWVVTITAKDQFDNTITQNIDVISTALAGEVIAHTVPDTTVYSDEPVVLDMNEFFTIGDKLNIYYATDLTGNGVNGTINGNVLTLKYNTTAITIVKVYACDQYGRKISVQFNASSIERVLNYGSITSKPIPSTIVTATSPLELDLSNYFTQTAGYPLYYEFYQDYPSNVVLTGSTLDVNYESDGNITVTVIGSDDYDHYELNSIEISFETDDNGKILVQDIPPARVTPDEELAIDLADYFSQTQGNLLIYDYYTPDSTGITVDGSMVTIKYVSDEVQTITFKASDAYGSSQSTDLVVTFTANHAPSLLNSMSLNFTSREATVLNLNEYFKDADNDPLQFTVKLLTTGGIISHTLENNILTVNPLESGSASLEIVASDGKDLITALVPVVVNIPNSSPIIIKELGVLSLTKGQVYELNLAEYFSHSAQKPLTITYNYVEDNLIITKLPNNVLKIEAIKVSESELKIKASDTDNKSVEQLSTVTVTEPRRVPEWINADSTVVLTKDANLKTIDLATLLISSEDATFSYTVTDKISEGAVMVTREQNVLSISSESAGMSVISVDATNSIGQSIKPYLITVSSNINAELNPVSAKKAIEDTIFTQGFSSAVIDLATFFTEANGKPLTYTVVPATNAVVDLGIIGSRLSILEKVLGTVSLTVVATNTDGQSASVSFKISVNEKIIPISFITLPASINVLVGEVIEFNAKITPLGARYTSLVWEASPAGIVSLVTEDGYVAITGVKAGKTTLTLTSDNGVKSSISITVSEPKLVSLGLMFEKVSLYVGAQMPLPLVVTPSNFPLTDTNITVSNSTAVSIINGTVHALAAGTSNISIQLGNLKTTLIVTVSDKPVIADTVIIKLTGSPVAKITLDIQPAGASIGDYSLECSDDAIAYIENGYLHSIAPGTVTLMVKSDGMVIGQLDYTVANTAPVIKPIPVQTGAKDGNFKAIILSEYVTDDFTKSSDIVWSTKNTSVCKISIINGTAFATITNPFWTGTEAVTFIATDAQGATAERIVTFSSAPVSAKLTSKLVLAVYPNPANESVTVAIGEGAYEVKLFTLKGNLVLPIQKAEQGTCTMDISRLPAGTYIIQVLHDKELFTELLTVE